MLTRLKRMLFKNILMKGLSVILAVLLWYLASGQEKIEVAFTIPVELVNISETVAVEGSSLQFILVRLRGMKSSLQDLSLPQMRANVDLSALKPGDNYIPITGKDIQIPRGIELVSVSPPYLSIKASARKLVPINVKLRGKPETGYEVEKITAIPNNIYVIGPPRKVDRIKEIDTYTISIRGASNPIQIKADLVSPDPEVRLMELKPTEVSILIRELTVEKTFGNVPINLAEGEEVKLTPDRVQVRLSGPYKLMQTLEEKDIEVVLEDLEAGEDQSGKKVKVRGPEGTSVLEIKPTVVKAAK